MTFFSHSYVGAIFTHKESKGLGPTNNNLINPIGEIRNGRKYITGRNNIYVSAVLHLTIL